MKKAPLLGIRFALDIPELRVAYPDGRLFKDMVALDQQRQQIQTERDRLAAKLLELGIDPETV